MIVNGIGEFRLCEIGNADRGGCEPGYRSDVLVGAGDPNEPTALAGRAL
jgi:hypothetical protein